jgi:hypothetical protein
MKRLQVKVSSIYCIDVPDDFRYDSEEDVEQAVADYLGNNNMKASIEFFSNLSVVCSECGCSLNEKEEEEDGMCAQCNSLFCIECHKKLKDEEGEEDGLCKKCKIKK